MFLATKRNLLLSSLLFIGHSIFGQYQLSFDQSQDSTQRILILEKLDSDKRDTIYPGSYMKLWIKAEKACKKLQPLIRMDFNRYTVYYESTLVTVNDSFLVLLKNQGLPFFKKKSLFDTIPLKQIFAIRGYNKDVEIATTSAVLIPAIPFVPSDLLTFPWIFAIIPISQTVMQTGSNIINPMRRLKQNNNFHYRLFTGEKNFDSVYSIVRAPKLEDGQYEWEVDKQERWKKSYCRATRILDKRLLSNNTGNKFLALQWAIYSFLEISEVFPIRKPKSI